MLSIGVFLVGVVWVSGASPDADGLLPLEYPVDLTHTLNSKSYPWPGNSPFRFTKRVETVYKDGGFITYNEFATAEHVGTHMDAPFHFNKNGWKVAEIPVSHLVARGVVLDASAAAAADRNLALGADALHAWEAKHGPLPCNSIVLVRFGWAEKYPDRAAYFGSDSDDVSTFSFPGVSEELAKALVKRGVVGVGVDVPSVDTAKASNTSPVAHRVFCGANVFILENVNLRTKKLNDKIFTVNALPAKIGSGTGAPVWIAAFPRSD